MELEALPQRGASPGAPLVALVAPLRLVDVVAEEADRISTGVPELDRVLGGGLVPASLVLVGGEPGVGKSTLLLAALGAISRDRRALLVTGEESRRAGQAAGGAARGLRRRGDPRRDRTGRGVRHARARAPCRLRDRLGADALVAGGRFGARVGLPGARGGRAAAAGREGVRRRDVPRRPCHQGRVGRGAARPGASRRLRAAVRGRPLPRAPHPARREEPVRVDERARHLRDDGRRPRRRARSVRGLRPLARGRGRRGSRLRARGNQAAAARDPVARLAHRPGDAAAGRHGRRSEAPRDDRGGARTSRRAPARRRRRLRQRRRRGAHRRAGRRSRHRPRHCLCGAGDAGPGEPRSVRRDRPHGTVADGRAGRPAGRGVPKARPPLGSRPDRNQGRDHRSRDPESRPFAPRSGANPL